MAEVTDLVHRMTLSEQEFQLPTEIWQQIFGHLRAKQLLAVRLVCRRWKSIADGKRSMWTNTRIRFALYTRFDEQFRMESWVPASCCELFCSRVVNVTGWWPSFGEHLTSMTLDRCELTLETLVEMLRYTPNLKQLHLDHVRKAAEEEPVVDFQLDRMEELDLDCEIFEVFVQVCPHLRSLQMRYSVNNEETLSRMLRSVQGTLERLEFDPTPYLLQEITNMKLLKLKSVKLLHWHNDQHVAVQLSQILPSLKEIYLQTGKTSLSDLKQIVANCPNLEQLLVKIDKEVSNDLAFLGNMIHLKRLTLWNDDSEQMLKLKEMKCPNLEELELSGFRLVCNNEQSFLAGSKKLQRLSLLHCKLKCWTDLIMMILELPSLKRLELESSRAATFCMITVKGCTGNLESIELYDCETMHHNILTQLAVLCPRMKNVLMHDMPQIDDETVQSLCRQLPRLTQLAIPNCSVTAASAEYIVDHCHALQCLRIVGCNGFCEALQKLLKDRRRYIELEISKTFM